MADPNNQSGTESANITCSINIDENVDLRKSNEVRNDNKKDYSSMSDAQNMEDIKTRKKKLVEDLSKFVLLYLFILLLSTVYRSFLLFSFLLLTFQNKKQK